MDPVSLIATTSAITTIAGKTLEDKESYLIGMALLFQIHQTIYPYIRLKRLMQKTSQIKTKKALRLNRQKKTD